MLQKHSTSAYSDGVTPFSGVAVNCEIDFLPVGDSNGDCICLRYGQDDAFYIHVVDGGFTDTAARAIEHIEKHYGKGVFINHMVLTHADNDHAMGLIGILEHFEVRELWMNRPWLYAAETIHSFHDNWSVEGLTKYLKDKHPYLVELERIATEKGTTIHSVFQGAVIGSFTVLAPSYQRYLRLIPDLDKSPPSYAPKTTNPFSNIWEATKDVVAKVFEDWGVETLDKNPPATSASNETSVVQFGVLGEKKVLLTGDVGPEGLNEAADYATAAGLMARPDMMQVPHHGSRRNVTPAVLNRWLGPPLPFEGVVGSAFCSVGKDADIYPRKKVKNAFTRRGYPVHATRGETKYFFHGWTLRPGWGASKAEPFSNEVED